MRNAEDTVKKPLITEKSTIKRDQTGVYCFRADIRANKIEIAKAVEDLFGVKVADVRTSMVRGKTKRMGRFVGKRPDWKKAWVRLTDDSKEIDFFEAS
jgi:large subunit ribosomal protein L23